MTANNLPGHKDILEFWFSPANRDLWFKNDNNFDLLIKTRFYDIWKAACSGELFSWRLTIEGRLAEIIILDQFSRNLNRGSGKSYHQDGMALILSQELISLEGWKHLGAEEKAVSLLPWMHSESRLIHDKAKALYASLPLPGFLEYEIKHSEIIERFGRYPYRNAILGRRSTHSETDWMNTHSSFL